MKNLKITLSIATLFIASLSIQATELQEQNVQMNQQALYQLDLLSVSQPELEYRLEMMKILSGCAEVPECDAELKEFNQPLEIQLTSTQE